MAEKKMRNTPQRQLVYKIVSENHDHPTAEAIYQQARLIDPTISMGTVYRNLAVLSEMGEINDLPMPQGPNHYDYLTKPHAHFYCKCCGKIFDVNADDIFAKDLDSLVPDCEVENFDLVFSGTCSECCKKQHENK